MCNLEYHFSFFMVNTVLICVFEQVLMDGKVPSSPVMTLTTLHIVHDNHYCINAWSIHRL